MIVVRKKMTLSKKKERGEREREREKKDRMNCVEKKTKKKKCNFEAFYIIIFILRDIQRKEKKDLRVYMLSSTFSNVQFTFYFK